VTLAKDLHGQSNRLLGSLPAEEYQRIYPYLELVTLSTGQVIYEIGEFIPYVYFPQNCIVSLVSILENGSTIEVGLVGNEGMVGIPVILGGFTRAHQAFVQVPNDALRMKAEILKTEFDRGGAFQGLLLRYVQALFTQVSQTAVCNRFHPVEKRLARWLLLVSYYLQSEEFFLTQEFIGQMLGVHRSGVTVAAGLLSQAGLIQYTRGKITICDRNTLEAFSCECYSVIRDEFSRLLDP
jgi:CRP-like cAMP-binding protein